MFARPRCCDSGSRAVSLLVPTCVLQKQRANALHMGKRAMTNNDDGSYRLLSRPPFKGPLGVNPWRSPELSAIHISKLLSAYQMRIMRISLIRI